MYRVYVLKQRKSGSEVINESRTQSSSFAVAAAAFWELYKADYDNTHLLLMSKDNKQVNAYRYGSRPEDRDFLAEGDALKS